MRKLLIVLLTLLSLQSAKELIYAHSETEIIEMTKDGFNPSQVTIDENTTLNFVNKDTKDHWPASDIHPTHEVFAEFDPKRPIKPGDFWLFQPKKVGSWKYHDHLLPHKRGVITIVAESEDGTADASAEASVNTTIASSPSNRSSSGIWQEIINFFQQILNHFVTGLGRVFGVKPSPSPNPMPLTSQVFKNMSSAEQMKELTSFAQTSGAEAAWQLIRETFKGESGTLGNIHDLSHLTGQLLYQEKGLPALNLCTPEFAFGCFHGFLDTAFRESLAKLPETETACATLGPGISGPVASCIHGIGHGVASFHKTEDLKGALESCNELSEAARQYCYDGVFMEFERNASLTFYKKDQLLFPCDQLESQYVFSCGRNQPQVLMRRFKKSFAEVSQICLNAESKDFKTACFDALGFLAASIGEGKPEKVVAMCQQITQATYYEQCVKAAAGEIVFQEMPQWYVTAYQVCGALAEVPGQTCLSYIEQLMNDYGRLRPRTQGEDPNTYIQSPMRICTSLGGRNDCYKKVAGFISEQFDLRASLQLLKNNENVPEVYARCHEVTHYIARSAYEKERSIPEVYAQCDSTCHGGCYHGVLEAYLKEKQLSIGNQLQTEFVKICGNPDIYEKPLIFYECMHGLGHAAMFITDKEVPLSLQYCDLLAPAEHRERCYSGVFMENSSSSTSVDHPGKYVKADDPMYPCNILGEKYLSLCYRYQSSHFALITKHDWLKVSNLCLQVPEPYRHDCFRTIGTNQVGFTQDFVLMKKNCELVPLEFRQTCYAGVIGSLSYRFVEEPRLMIDFCQSVETQYKEACFSQMGLAMAEWSRDTKQVEAWCSQIQESIYISTCISASKKSPLSMQ